MALTNFAALTTEQKTIWSLDLWKQARNMSFVNRFLGKGPNSLIQHITELKQSEKGARAVITLLADLTGDGVAGDRTLEGNEEAMQTFDQVIRIDQLRHANRHEGRMADQKSVVEFRGNSRDVLAYWLADRIDQMAFLTLAGRSYTLTPNGATRIGSDLKNLEFAADVSAPSNARRLRWDGTSATKTLVANAATTGVAATDLPMWEMFVQLKAYAKNRYIRGIKEDGGEETFHAFLTPDAMAKLKMDQNYMLNLRHAQQRDKENPLFSGSSVKIDGIYLHEFRHVPNTRDSASGSKYGAAGTVDGCQVLFCGAQALAMADIKSPEWNEKGFDYENSQGIAVGKILGFLKPKFGNIYESGSTEDFGVISCYVAN
ncbi:MAG: N4-gp56 family major capsid protein [Proteobacteria bacterium]|nr:N4-gp56 family major capsid protein [Pseudomonadota bacterium]